VIVSHELASIFNIAHRVLLFQGSKQTLVAQGKPRELAEKSDDPWVRAFFNRETPRQEARDGKAAEKGRTGARRAGGDAPPAGQSDGKRGAP
jgi:ABC-type transporter Mla maintaining outer membrane lipid asymmetry ATPase subunit MlaF